MQLRRRKVGSSTWNPLLVALILPTALLLLVGASAVTRVEHHPMPEARTLAGLIADPLHHGLVLFGGRGVRSDLDDTWTWDGNTWSQRHPAVSPPPQENVQLVWDGARGRVLLVNGQVHREPSGQVDDHPLNELWAWDGATWHQESPDWAPTGNLRDHLLAWDTSHSYLVMADMDTAPVLPAAVPIPSGVHVAPPLPPGRRPPGVAAGPAPVPPTVPWPPRLVTSVHTWTWDGGEWTDRGETGLPAAFDGAVVATDEASGRVILLARAQPPSCVSLTGQGGAEPSAGQRSSPSPPAPVTVPDPTPVCSPAYHEPDHACTDTSYDNAGTEQWVWDGAAWRSLSARGLPCGFIVDQMVTDPGSRHVLLRGGSNFICWDGDRWHSTHPVGAFDRRDGEALAADPERHQVVLFGGRRAGEEGNDLWTWDGYHWHGHAGTPPPTPVPTDPPPSDAPTLPGDGSDPQVTFARRHDE